MTDGDGSPATLRTAAKCVVVAIEFVCCCWLVDCRSAASTTLEADDVPLDGPPEFIICISRNCSWRMSSL